LRENLERPDNQEKSKRQQRPEMKGPSDLSDILSGLKTKTINIQETQQQQAQPTVSNTGINTNDNSTISISDLKDLQGDGNMPKRSKRRQKSVSNTISLDI
jgi:multidrug efflux pump subunit AcrB